MENWSDKFIINSEVPQGSILDTKLFDAVTDIMLEELKMNMFGCHVNERFMDSIACTDAIVLLFSCRVCMLELYSKFCLKCDLKFSVQKSCCWCFGELISDIKP